MANINDYINNNFELDNAHNIIVARNNLENMRNNIRQRLINIGGNLEQVKRVLLAHLDWTILMNTPPNTQLLAADVQQTNRNCSMINNIIITNNEQLIIDDVINTVAGLTQDDRKLYYNLLQNL